MSGLRGMVGAVLVGVLGGGGTVGYFWYTAHQAAEGVKTTLEAQVADAESRAVAAARRASLLTVQVELSEATTTLAQKNFGIASEHLANARKAAEGVEPLVAALAAIDLGVTDDVSSKLSALVAASEQAERMLAE